MILGIIFCVLSVIGMLLMAIYDDSKRTSVDTFNFTLGCFFGIGFILIALSHEPKAIDVYRGNTKLNVTSVNGVPTDSVVVFKNK